MAFASENLTFGQMDAIVKMLGGEQGALRFLRGELKLVETQPREFAIWKTIKLGTCKTPDEYRKALKQAGRRIGNGGDDILGRIACSQEEVELDLVALSVADLGLKDNAHNANIYTKALELGLELCPAEVGPALRLQYSEQPRGECVQIAMEPVIDRVGDRNIFSVEHDGGGLWLPAYPSLPDDVWHAGSRFVFARRK